MVKFEEQVIQNNKLLEQIQNNKKQSLEMQLENSNLGSEMKKTNTDKKKPNSAR